MKDLTEEEYDTLDELWTKTTPKVTGDGKSGFFMKHKGNIIVDMVSKELMRENIETATLRLILAAFLP